MTPSPQLGNDSASKSLDRTSCAPHRLTIFAFVWACQALVHQEFYSGWLHDNDPRGWAVTICALGTLLRPSSLFLFCGLLLSSIVYNVVKWPFVVNHILLESIINGVILVAIATSRLRRGRPQARQTNFRDEAIDRFAPVVTLMLVIMYWFAFVAKLNTDFINPNVSCVVAMYGDLIRRFPFLPDTPAAHQASIALTLLVEAAIPLLLSFRRTRWVAILIGLPFHLVLGLIGHRTFSALAYALYALMLIDTLGPFIAVCQTRVSRYVPATTWRRGSVCFAVALVVGVAGLIIADVTGNFRFRLAGVSVYRIPWIIWIGWSLVMSALVSAAIFWQRMRVLDKPLAQKTAHPGWLWGAIPLVLLIGLSQYIGLKTETCFTMYSNLRTEGNWNNHLFMPAIKLGPWQNDLVRIIATDHPDLQEYSTHNDLLTFFELRRVVAGTAASDAFYLSYERAGSEHYLAWNDHRLRQSEPWGKHPWLLGKLLYFRPVPTDECVPCRH